MNWKYLAALFAIVATVGLVALIALEFNPNPEMSGKVVAQSPVEGVVVPGTDGKVRAFSNGVYSIEASNFAVSVPLGELPDRDPGTVEKELADPGFRGRTKQRRLKEVNEGRAAKGLGPMNAQEKAEFDINEQNAKVLKKSKPGLGADAGDGTFMDPLVEKGRVDLSSPQAMPTPSMTFNGVSAADNAAVGVGGLSPPDVNGDVGPNHYVSSVNLTLRVYDKNGTPIGSPKKTSDLFNSLPTDDACRRNDGDPIVLYDQLADRWHISQFSVPGFDSGSGANFQCVAISTTGDPNGSYYVWSYTYPGDLMNDYPKVSVWNDAYHMTFNQFNNAGTAFLGAGFFSQDRAKALAGDPNASAVYKNIQTVDPDAGGILPPDVEGFVPPPAGLAAVFMEYRADEFGDPADAIRSYKWAPDFTTPANSTFQVLADTTLAPYDARQPSGRADIEQSGGVGLDSLSDRVMHRLVYRNLGTYTSPINSIVGSFSVNVSGVAPSTAATYQTGIRWFEIRRTGDTFSVFDQGTHTTGPINGSTGLNNWMSSIATDSQGNIALGFSQSSSTQNADIKIAGRTNNAGGAGTLNEGEAMFFDATGSQTGSNRWGDYSSMNVDPSDDCTFWYTQEYYAATSSIGWATRVGKFKYPSCTSAAMGTISGTITSCASGLPVDAANVNATGGFNRLSIANGTYTMTVAPGSYTVSADKAPGFTGADVNVNVVSGGNATANICLNGVPVIEAGTAAIVTESCGMPNGTPDPGEQLSVSLPLTNSGGANTTNLVATLQATGGVTNPGAAQSYGALAAAGGSATRNFSFTTSGAVTCGADITLTWVLTDGATNLGTVVRTFSTGTPVVNVTQNFDSVTAPALPAGWTSTQAGGGTLWVTSATSPIGAPNSAFTNNPDVTSEASLESPEFLVSSAAGILEFDIFHDTENTFDGVVVEIKIGSGAYQDLLAAGGSFTQNGYNATLGNWSGCVANPNPLANRQAFTGGPATKAVRATLPAAANGQNVRIRFRMGSDCSVGDVGARIDNVKVTAGVTCNGPCGSTRTVRSDYDGDGKTDFAIWRPSEGNFWLLRSTAGAGAIQWGQNGDTPIAADLTGDRMSDIIAFRPGATTSDFSMFYTLGTPGYGYSGYPWGTQGDIPVMGDFNGDGKSDSAVYRPSESTFYLLLSDDPNPVRVLPFGTAGDIPFAGDFIGDGRSDLALYRPSNGTWYIAEAQGDPNTESIATPWGLSTDKPVAADYDGDNKDDIAVYRPSTGVWYILESQTQQIRIVQWGGPTDVPVPGDYDGDSKYDIAIFNNGQWWVLQSSGGAIGQQWGMAGDKAMPNSYLPQ